MFHRLCAHRGAEAAALVKMAVAQSGTVDLGLGLLDECSCTPWAWAVRAGSVEVFEALHELAISDKDSDRTAL